MLLLVTLCALVGLGGVNGQDVGYQPPSNTYGGYNDYASSAQLAAAIDQLRALVEVRQQVQTIHEDRIASLYESANENADFGNTFNAYIYDRMLAEQSAQDERLSHLEIRLAEIAHLRQSVDELHESVKDASDDIDYQQKEIKTAQYDVDCLENDGIDISSRIAVAQQRADAVMVAIDALVEDINENTLSLAIEELNVRQLIMATNRQMAVSPDTGSVTPGGRDSTLIVALNFVSTPQFSLASVIGFRIVNRPSYGYDQGYPTIYFELDIDVNRIEAHITGIDMSDGGYTTERIDVDVDAIYFDMENFTKDFLEGITGFS